MEAHKSHLPIHWYLIIVSAINNYSPNVFFFLQNVKSIFKKVPICLNLYS